MHAERVGPAHPTSDQPAVPVSMAVDDETTIDLLGQTTADLAAKATGDAPATTNSAAEEGASDMPKHRAWGFFVFLAAILIATIVATRHQSRSLPPEMRANSTPMSQLWVDVQDRSPPQTPSTSTEAVPIAVVAPEARTTVSAPVPVLAVTFASSPIVTSEQASAVVFIIRRAPPAKGRVSLQWAARSGSADAAIDFSDASGTVRFADGQQERAIYVPLRNDLLKEDNESFTVCLRSPHDTGSSEGLCAEATILDDDSSRP